MGFLQHLRRGGALSGRSYEPIMAILLFSCTLALHARQVDVRLRLDYLWAAQVSEALCLLGHGIAVGKVAETLTGYTRKPLLSSAD